jgi:hypothetical protein
VNKQTVRMPLKGNRFSPTADETIQDILCQLHGARLVLLKAGTVNSDVGPVLSSACNYIGLAIELINKNEEHIVMTPDYPCIFPWDRILSKPGCAMCMKHWPRSGGHDKMILYGHADTALQLVIQSAKEIGQTETAWKAQCGEYLAEALGKLAPLSQLKPARRRFRLFS